MSGASDVPLFMLVECARDPVAMPTVLGLAVSCESPPWCVQLRPGFRNPRAEPVENVGGALSGKERRLFVRVGFEVVETLRAVDVDAQLPTPLDQRVFGSAGGFLDIHPISWEWRVA